MLATLHLDPIDDNTLYEENGNNSNVLGEFLFIGNTSSTETRRAVMKFDIPSYLPAGTIITGAEPTLSMSDTLAGAENLELHRTTSVGARAAISGRRATCSLTACLKR